MEKVVIITGCSSGFGQAAARHFAQSGWHVFATMRNPAAGAALSEEAGRSGWRLTVLPLDVTRDDSVAAAVAAVARATGGRIDAVVNNAGYFCFGPVEDTHPDELRAQLETNVIGALRVSRAVLPVMRQQGHGRIINVSSLAARAVVPMLGPYHASKYALEALTEALHYEVRGFGIYVSSVLPGPFPTQLHKNLSSTSTRARPAATRTSSSAPSSTLQPRDGRACVTWWGQCPSWRGGRVRSRRSGCTPSSSSACSGFTGCLQQGDGHAARGSGIIPA